MAGYTQEALRETGMICVRAIVDVLEGRRPQGVINQRSAEIEKVRSNESNSL